MSAPAASRDEGPVPTYRDEAIVLRMHKLGEADRIVTMLTRSPGKVRAVAKGVRRTNSPLAETEAIRCAPGSQMPVAQSDNLRG